MSLSANYICGLGNPLLDMSCNTNQTQLDTYELKMGNAILAEEKHLPLYQEIANAEDVLYVAGGATQNSIRVAQWMLQQPGTTNYMGCIGNDAFGEQLCKCLQDANVGEYYQRDEKTPTGTCAVLIQDTERSLCANLAAANNFQQSHLETEKVKAMWQAASFYYIGGFFFTVSQDSIMQIARHAHANRNKTLAINLSAPFIPQFFGAGIAAVMPYVDIVIGNETEAAAYGSTVEGLGENPITVAAYISQLPKANKERNRICVITQGSLRTIVAVGGSVTFVDVPAVEAKEIVDTNGAGDAFVGGFISQYVLGHSLTRCCEAGHYSAAQIIKVSGCVCPEEPPTFA